jgi:protocatechuate 3,4-dioxygenase beta subunit
MFDIQGESVFRVCLICILALVSAAGLFAQGGESTQILGVVEDTSGATVPGVTVTIIQVATGQQRKTTSGESGSFVFTSLVPGEYNVRAEKPGFKTKSAPG